MTKKATLYTSGSLNGTWLLMVIDVAIWLHKTSGYTHIKIKTISNYKPFNLFSFFLRLKNLSSYLNKIKNKKFQNLISSSQARYNNINNLASFISDNLDQADLKIGNLDIEFVRERFDNKNFKLNNLKLIYRVIVDYFKFFRKSALKNKKYLEYQVADIYSGLHVLSEALRSDYRSGGSIFHCQFGILVSLYKLHCLLKDCRQIVLQKQSNSYVCGPEQEYIHGFFSKFLSDRGVCFVETTNKQQPFIKRGLKEKYLSRLNLSEIKINCPDIDKDKIAEYYMTSIDKPWKVKPYMHFLKKNNLSNHKLLNLKGLVAIVYLHSFTDAQYVYGYHGYHDIMDWSLRTISLLNSNEHVSKVIVKPHPGIDPSYFLGDVVANKYLKSQLLKFDKVEWADFHFDVNHINSSGLVVGITHHGSVAEELVFKKIPVIASVYYDWGEEYKFGYWWKDVKDYENLISSKSITELAVTNTQIDELYRYAMKKYFNTNLDTNLETNLDTNFDKFSSWQDMLRIYDGVEYHDDNRVNMEQINNLVSTIDPEDRQFKEYINTRLQRINLLKDLPTRLTI